MINKSKEEKNKVYSDLDKKIKLDNAYIECIRRKDKKYNFYLVPLSSIDEKDNKYYANSTYHKDVTINSVFIDGHLIKKIDFNSPLLLSLKPGKYHLLVNFTVNRKLGVYINSIISQRKNNILSVAAHNATLNYSTKREIYINVNGEDECFVLLKTWIDSTWKSKQSGYGELIWDLKDYRHSYEMYQTHKSIIENMCSFWYSDKIEYNYPEVDQETLIEVMAQRALDTAKTNKTTNPTTTTTTSQTQSKANITEFKFAGGIYKGEIQNKQLHGFGTCIWDDGDKYVGYYQNGKRHGKGTYYYKNGDRFEGNYQNGMREGEGIYYYKDGSSKKGVWKLDKYVETSTTSSSNMVQINNVDGNYYGEVLNGKYHGFGTYKFYSGDKYVGYWKNGKRHGQGTYYYKNGDRHEGNFFEGLRDGKGVYYFKNGTIKKGTWRAGKFIE